MKRFQFIQPIGIRIGALLLLYAYARLLFLCFNPEYQGNWSVVLNAFWVGSWFDISAIIYTNSPVLLAEIIRWFWPSRLLHKGIQILFVVLNIPFLLLNFIDIQYIHFTGKRSGVDILSEAGDWGPLIQKYVLDFWYLILLFLPIIWLLFRTNSVVLQLQAQSNIRSAWAWILFVPVLGILFLGARGGWGLTPLTTPDASKFVGGKNIALAVNTPFNFIMTLQQQGLQEVHYMSEAAALHWFNPEHRLISKSENSPNIVLIIVESLGKEYVGSRFGKHSLTPFLDSLTHYCTEYTHAYSNGKRSIEGIPAILSGMPTWMNSDYLSSFYQANRLSSIGDILQHKKYDCSFYHGGRNGTMSFDNYIALSNGGAYFGLNEYPNKNDFDGSWGIFDDRYLSYWKDALSTKKSPFFSCLFTLSSHHPYTIPNELKSRYQEGSLPIHKSIRYADDALNQFFNAAKKTNWYANTLFVITADHASENEEAYFQSPQGKYAIPLWVFRPANPQYQIVSRTVSQSDIPGIILENIPNNSSFFSFGSYPEDSFAVQFQDGYYQLIQYPYVYQLNDKGPSGFYEISSDSLMQKNRMHENNAQKERMDKQLKAVIQQYNDRLIHNQSFIH